MVSQRSLRGCACSQLNLTELDRPIRDAMQVFRRKGICTNSSEGGGKQHASPHFAYIEAHLTKENRSIAQNMNVLLRNVTTARGKALFLGDGLEYGRKTGFYLVGFQRKGMTDGQVREKMLLIAWLLLKILSVQ